MIPAMDGDPLARFDRAVALAAGAISAVRAEQLGDPTPCSEWSVRQLINHVVVQTLMFVSMVTAGPRPDRDEDRLGDDPLAAFRDCADRLRGALSRPGVVRRADIASAEEGPGLWTLNLSVVELTVHSWDIARATGQRTDIDPGLAHYVLGVLREGLPPDRRGSPFGAEQPAPAYLPIAERMAAFAGRRVE
jgi:uncharacterized protein (TIGR03086 family)